MVKARFTHDVARAGNANENTKSLFRDRLQARATPTLAMFDSTGKMGHSHTGANKAKLEFYLREYIGETDSETLYPPYQLTGGSSQGLYACACCVDVMRMFVSRCGSTRACFAAWPPACCR